MTPPYEPPFMVTFQVVELVVWSAGSLVTEALAPIGCVAIPPG